MSQSIFSDTSPIGKTLSDAVKNNRLVMIAGLPSSGKSLLFQQLTILASESGRTVHTLQWDDARHPFETEHWLSVYPDPAPGTTHTAIRKAIGFWVRGGIERWSTENPAPENVLIIEIPIVGGRFIELIRPVEDSAETLLGSDQAAVIVPIPTNALRKKLEEFRAATHANPRNDGEAMEAAPSVVRADWLETRQLYNGWNGIADDPARDAVYDQDVAQAVFEHLTRYRNTELLNVDKVFDTKGSTFDRPVPVKVFRPTEPEVSAAYTKLATLFPNAKTESATDDWADY